jgi:hypothetical protein
MVGFSAEWIIHKAYKYEGVGELKDNVRIASALVMTSGIFACITSVLAICGAAASNRCLLIAYSLVMALILFFEIGGAVAGFISYDYVKSGLTDHLDKEMNKYRFMVRENDREWSMHNNDLFRVQYYFHCCGVKNASDWEKAENWTSTRPKTPTSKGTTPSSCCLQKEDNIICAKDDDLLNKGGCYHKMREVLPYIGVASIVIFFIQLVMLIIAIFLSRRIKKDQEFAIF